MSRSLSGQIAYPLRISSLYGEQRKRLQVNLLQLISKGSLTRAIETSSEHGNTSVRTQEKVLSRTAVEQRVESWNLPAITT